MEGSFDEVMDSSQAAKRMMGRVVLRMEWLVPLDQWLSVDGGRGRDTWQALQETGEEAGRAAEGRCLLVSSSLGISSNLPLVLRCSFSSEENG